LYGRAARLTAENGGFRPGQVTDYREIRSSRRELQHLKACWDMASMVSQTFEDYRSILWAEIDVDGLTDECKKLTKIVRRCASITLWRHSMWRFRVGSLYPSSSPRSRPIHQPGQVRQELERLQGGPQLTLNCSQLPLN
jgi:hypothetical protein